MTSPSLAVAVCTRDREADLVRAVRTVLHDAATLDEDRRRHTEIVVVDDGRVPDHVIDGLRDQAQQALVGFTYHRKTERPGLLRSRIVAVGMTSADVVLFVDDDIEMAPGYLDRLLRHFASSAGVVGVGGIDVLGRPERRRRTVAAVLTGAAALRRGRFSCAGFNGDCARWPAADRPFRSEYLVGFNMAFRRAALLDLDEPPWLSGYGLGEDLYVSLLAARSGALVVDPRLTVAHHQAPSTFDGRDNHRRYHAAKAANHAYLLAVMGAPAWRFLAWRMAVSVLFAHHAVTWAVARPGPVRDFRRTRMIGCREGIREAAARLRTRSPLRRDGVTHGRPPRAERRRSRRRPSAWRDPG